MSGQSSFPLMFEADPGLGLLRLAALLAEVETEPDDETLDAMEAQVSAGVLAGVAASDMWEPLVQGLMGIMPSNMIYALSESGALEEILPEVSALYGVPQLSDEGGDVDLGHHLLHALDEAARTNQPLAVRFALLVMNVGKFDSPKEHLPVHYRHIDRGRPRIEAICGRFGAPADCRDLALMALSETERVHRVSEIRAGPVAAMLQRLGAFDNPDRFHLFMDLCACDFRAHPSRAGQEYAKSRLLNAALAACEKLTSPPENDLEMARATAIAQAFRSERWS